jgi:beta-lactamase class A
MSRLSELIIILLTLGLSQQASADALLRQISSRVEAVGATTTLYARNLDTGAEFSLQADRPVRTASTIKLPIACAVEHGVAKGAYDWSDRLVIRGEDKVSGSGVLREWSDGETISLRDAVNLMIVVSDNTATNLLLDRMGGDRVNGYLQAIGLQRTRVLRKIRGDGTALRPAEGWTEAGRMPEHQGFGIGISTAREMVRLLEMLANGEVVDAASSQRLLQILERQQYKDGIGRGANGLRVASKSGALDALRSDVGIVFAPQGRIAIAMTVDGLAEIDDSPDNIGERLIADVTRILIAELD